MDIIGHKKQIKYLRLVQKNKVLNHAYLFSGPSHIGKRAIAELIACDELEVEKVKKSPNFRRIKPEIDQKTKKRKSTIGIDQIREITSIAAKGGLGHTKNIILIDHAELMTIAAQNALLKTLEEPGSSTHIFLIATHGERLLPTIRSRVTELTFGPVPMNEYPEDAIKQMKKEPEYIQRVIQGRPGLLFILQTEERVILEEELEELRNIHESKPYKKMVMIDALAKKTTPELQKMLDDWISLYRNEISACKQEEVLEAKKLLSQNVNKTLVLEKAFL